MRRQPSWLNSDDPAGKGPPLSISPCQISRSFAHPALKPVKSAEFLTFPIPNVRFPAMPATASEEPILGGMHICRPKPFVIKREEPIGLRLMSDLHIGAAHVDYKMIQQELFEAEEQNDRVLINGDLLDLVLPKDVKRYEPTNAHPRIAKRSD